MDGNAYGQRIKKLIQSKYRVDPSFAGKQCDVKIFLSRDGTITNYQVVSGDKAVCDAAVSAIVATRKCRLHHQMQSIICLNHQPLILV